MKIHGELIYEADLVQKISDWVELRLDRRVARRNADKC